MPDAPQPLRGEVWDAAMARVGPHPVVIFTINPLLQRLGSFTAVLVSGSDGPRTTHVPLGRDAGLTRYRESYAAATELHNVPITSLRVRRGRLALAELRALEEAVRIAHGLVEVCIRDPDRHVRAAAPCLDLLTALTFESLLPG